MVFSHKKERGKLHETLQPWEKCWEMGEKKLLWLTLPFLVWQWILSTPSGAQTPPRPRAGPCTCRHTANLSTLWVCVPPGISNTEMLGLDCLPNQEQNMKYSPWFQNSPRHLAQGQSIPRKGGQSPLPGHSCHKPKNCFLKHLWERGGTDSRLQTYLTCCTVQLGKRPCTLYPHFTKSPAKELYPKGILGYTGSKH